MSDESSVNSCPASWAGLDSVMLGLPDPADPVVGVNELLGGFTRCVSGESFLAFTEFQLAAELYGRLVEPVADSDVSLIDAFAQCAARIAIAHAMSQRAAEQLLSEAVALRDRLPQVATCLRDGVLTRRQTTTIISRTALAEGQDLCARGGCEDRRHDSGQAWSVVVARDPRSGRSHSVSA